MNKEFKIEKCPYDENKKLFTKTSFKVEDNSITCLVGCNGSGKSTIIKSMICQLKEEKYKDLELDPFASFKNLFNQEGEKEDCGYILFNKSSENNSSQDDIFLNRMMTSYVSMGEGIVGRYGRVLQVIRNTIREGNLKELYIFLDDCDAGTSIDVICEIKEVLNLVSSECAERGVTYHIIITANSYELCHEFCCINVTDFKPINFKSYNSFKRFVLKSRALKDKRKGESTK